MHGVGDKEKTCVPQVCRIVCSKCLTAMSLEQDINFVTICEGCFGCFLQTCRSVVDWEEVYVHVYSRGGSRGGGPWGQDPPPFWGAPKLHKEVKKTLRACARKRRILVLNSYPDPPLSEILYPPLYSQKCVNVPWKNDKIVCLKFNKRS